MIEAPPPGAKADLASLKIDRSRKNDDYGGLDWKRAAIWLVVLAGLLLLTVFGYKKVVARRRAPAVETMTVRSSVIASNAPLLTATGYLVADRQASLSPKLAGKVARLTFDTGSKVRRGEVLAVLEGTQIEAQLAEARASYDEASREYARQSALWRAGVTARSLLDSASSQREVARARLEQVRVMVADTTIRAPFDGTITAKNVEVGEVVSPLSISQNGSNTTGGGSIATLADLSTLELEADVNESNLGQLRAGQPAEVSVDAFPGMKFRGRLRQIVPTADRAKGVVKVKVALESASDRLLPEMSASASFLQKERTNEELLEKPKLWLPSTAIFSKDGRNHVAVVKPDARVELRVVTTGLTRETRTEIVSGLADGDKIVTSSPGSLENGQKIKLAEGS